jgi:hypothetical protein
MHARESEHIKSSEEDMHMFVACMNYIIEENSMDIRSLVENNGILETLKFILMHPMAGLAKNIVHVLAGLTKLYHRTVFFERYFSPYILLEYSHGDDFQTILDVLLIMYRVLRYGLLIHSDGKYADAVRSMLQEFDIFNRKDVDSNKRLVRKLEKILALIPLGALDKNNIVEVVVQNIMKYRASKIGPEITKLLKILLRKSFTTVFPKVDKCIFNTLTTDPMTNVFNHDAMKVYMIVLDMIVTMHDKIQWIYFDANYLCDNIVKNIVEHSIFGRELLKILNQLIKSAHIHVPYSEEFTMRLISFVSDDKFRGDVARLLHTYYIEYNFHKRTLHGLYASGVLDYAIMDTSDTDITYVLRNIQALIRTNENDYANYRLDVFVLLNEACFTGNFVANIDETISWTYNAPMLILAQEMSRVVRIMESRSTTTLEDFTGQLDIELEKYYSMNIKVGNFSNILSCRSRVGDIGTYLQILVTSHVSQKYETDIIRLELNGFITRFIGSTGHLRIKFDSVFPYWVRYQCNISYVFRGMQLSPDLSLMELPDISNSGEVHYRIRFTGKKKTLSKYSYKKCVVEIGHPTDCPMHTPEPELVLVPIARCIFETLYYLDERHGSILEKERLSREMYHRLSGIEDSVMLNSPAIEFIHKYPQCFHYSLRAYAYSMRNLPLYNRLFLYIHEYTKEDPDMFLRSDPMRLYVPRDDILGYGRPLLYTMCNNTRSVEIAFSGEAGRGRGPNYEFFNLFAEQFLGEISLDFRENGYFPHPTTPKRDMVILGILLARVLYFGMTIGVRLNPLFFEVMRSTDEYSEEVVLKSRLAKIDPQLLDSLYSGASLMNFPFILQGRRSRPLDFDNPIKQVTSVQTESEYRYLMMSSTCGCVYRRNMYEAFAEGFNSVFPYEGLPYMMAFGLSGLFNMFTDDECVLLFSGISDIFNERDLESIVISGLCDEDSPQVMMFKNIVRRWSIDNKIRLLRFITAKNTLPYGGLANLRPRLTLWFSPFSITSYPKATVCEHRFEMPVYQSEAVMEMRMLSAMDLESNSFGEV